jgi:heme-degrading monooxygenase HmoA
MIIRTWRARAAVDQRDGYPRHFAAVVLPRLRSVPGFLGAQLLARDTDGEVEFVVQTRWASREAVERFAGPTPDVAVVDPDAEATLTAYDRAVTHHEVLVDA